MEDAPLMDHALGSASLGTAYGTPADDPGANPYIANPYIANPYAADPNTLILALAGRQHGVIARWQLKQLGVPLHRVDYRLKKGWLEPVHHGVYRVGPIAPPRYREMAALLACGAGAVLSHESAGALWEVLPPPGAATPVAVSTARNVVGPAAGVQVHRMVRIAADETTRFDDLPLTSTSRTLLDLASTLSVRALEQALARADRKSLLDRADLELLMLRYPGRRGNARLRALISSSHTLTFTRSEAEERFLALVRKAGLRPPEMNVKVRGFEVDALWRAERLVVEIDGYAYHSSPMDFKRDRNRDGVLAAAGFRVMRVIWYQLTHEPEVLLVRLAQALVSGGES